jgi:hypothetical protein
MTLRATKICVSILMWLFLFCLCSPGAWACDAGDFVQEEFGERCLLMGEMVKNLLATQRMDMPNKTKARASLGNEWVSFYLSHGEEAPASFTGVLPGAWKQSMRYVGQQIADLLYQRLEVENADSICVVFDLIALKNLLENAHRAMADWESALSKPVGETLAETTDWLGYSLNAYSYLTHAVGEQYSGLTLEAKRFIDGVKRRWVEVLRAEPAVQDTLYRLTKPRLEEQLRNEFKRYKLITLYDYE